MHGQEIPIDSILDTDAVRRWFDAAPARDIEETTIVSISSLDERVAVSSTLLSIATNSSVYLEGHVELVAGCWREQRMGGPRLSRV